VELYELESSGMAYDGNPDYTGAGEMKARGQELLNRVLKLRTVPVNDDIQF
jgi:hypothetical protein